ncbi:hypothetical protein FQN49_002857 [Arthroderma sp. PD_2]|nr:hypothetical protein FQN49_002857 [Arthroderma sp. PD_2]
MGPFTNQMLNAQKEEGCIAYTLERKYYEVGQAQIKRSLRPSEWQTNPYTGGLVIPRSGKERLLNEAATMKFIAENTDIPIAKLLCCFEDDDAIYLITQKVDGIPMSKLEESKRKIVEKEVETILETLHNIKSKTWGGPTGLVLPPYHTGSPRLGVCWIFLPEFEGAYYKRPGLSAALEGEEDDVEILTEIMLENAVPFGGEADMSSSQKQLPYH